MPQIYWDTPVLQWNVQYTAPELCYSIKQQRYMKAFRNSDHTLQLGYVKLESLVIVD